MLPQQFDKPPLPAAAVLPLLKALLPHLPGRQLSLLHSHVPYVKAGSPGLLGMSSIIRRYPSAQAVQSIALWQAVHSRGHTVQPFSLFPIGMRRCPGLHFVQFKFEHVSHRSPQPAATCLSAKSHCSTWTGC